MPIHWRLIHEKPSDVTVRAFRDLLKGAWQAVGEWWDKEIKPRHLDADAADRYGYQPRKDFTLKRKAAIAKHSPRVLYGGKRPLIWSGRTREAVLLTQIPRAFPTRMTIEMPTPKYVQMNPKKPSHPNLGEELTRLTPDELAQAELLWVVTFLILLQRYREQRVQTG